MAETEELFISSPELDSVISLLQTDHAVDFSGYARSSLSRRVARFRKYYHLASLDELVEFLEADPAHVRLFVHEITVNTTEMFRDPECWLFLRNELLPQLRDYNTIRIWHAGCSTGEEVYSMAILLHEAGLLEKSKLVASDLNAGVLERTMLGSFRHKDLESYCRNYIQSGGENDFSSYFDSDEENLRVRSFLKQNIHFKLHNLARLTPFSKFDLILCRNVMIYFNAQLQSDVVKMFSESLFKSGFLAIGKKENINILPSAAAFRVVNQSERIYSLR